MLRTCKISASKVCGPRDPKLAAAIEATDNQASNTVEPSRSGPPTLRVRSTDGRDLYLHSRHEPIKEAEQLIAPIDTKQSFVVFLHGFGLGYHAELLFERISRESILAVLEPDACAGSYGNGAARIFQNDPESGRLAFLHVAR